MNGELHPASPPRRQRWSVVAGAGAAPLVAGTLVAVNAAPAAAATVDTNAWYVLVNRNSGKALDVYGLATNDGARISQWTRNDGANQQWQFVDSGGGYYRLKSRHSGKVLDVSNASTADGAAIIQWRPQRTTSSSANHSTRPRPLSTSSNKRGGAGASPHATCSVFHATANQRAVSPRTTPHHHHQFSPCGKTPTLTNGTHTIQSSG